MPETKEKISRERLPLAGVRVLDLTRLAPGPYATMLLADLGAEVIVVGGGRSGLPVPELSRGKRFISLDLKKAAGQEAFRQLAETANVLIEGFRPGVMDRLSLGYRDVSQLRPDIVYCSLTGYGQSGPRARQAGHDINYLAVTGVLGTLGPADGPPVPPLNLLADFAAGSLVAAFGIVCALFSGIQSGVGTYIDTAMIDGCLSLMNMHFPMWGSDFLKDRGLGLLNGGAPFYRCYRCADGKYIAVGALENAFFRNLWRGIRGKEEVPEHMDVRNWAMIGRVLEDAFLQKTRDEWAELFFDSDACVTPVLSPTEAWKDPHVAERFGHRSTSEAPVIPQFDKQAIRAGSKDLSDVTDEVLSEVGLGKRHIEDAKPDQSSAKAEGLAWPPRPGKGSGQRT